MKDKIQGTENQNTNSQIQNTKKNRANDEENYRVVISKDAKDALENVLNRANEGFEGGEVTKSDIVNLMLVNSTKFFSDTEIKTLRNLHFNEREMLKTLLRKTKDEGDLPEEVKRALREHYGMLEQTKKRSPRNHVEMSTEKSVDNSSAA